MQKGLCWWNLLSAPSLNTGDCCTSLLLLLFASCWLHHQLFPIMMNCSTNSFPSWWTEPPVVSHHDELDRCLEFEVPLPFIIMQMDNLQADYIGLRVQSTDQSELVPIHSQSSHHRQSLYFSGEFIYFVALKKKTLFLKIMFIVNKFSLVP